MIASFYSVVFLSGSLVGVLGTALIQAFKDRRLDEKEVLLTAVALFGAICLFVCIVYLFNLTLISAQLTMYTKCSVCNMVDEMIAATQAVLHI